MHAFTIKKRLSFYEGLGKITHFFENGKKYSDIMLYKRRGKGIAKLGMNIYNRENVRF